MAQGAVGRELCSGHPLGRSTLSTLPPLGGAVRKGVLHKRFASFETGCLPNGRRNDLDGALLFITTV